MNVNSPPRLGVLNCIYLSVRIRLDTVGYPRRSRRRSGDGRLLQQQAGTRELIGRHRGADVHTRITHGHRYRHPVGGKHTAIGLNQHPFGGCSAPRVSLKATMVCRQDEISAIPTAPDSTAPPASRGTDTCVTVRHRIAVEPSGQSVNPFLLLCIRLGPESVLHAFEHLQRNLRSPVPSQRLTARSGEERRRGQEALHGDTKDWRFLREEEE